MLDVVYALLIAHASFSAIVLVVMLRLVGRAEAAFSSNVGERCTRCGHEVVEVCDCLECEQCGAPRSVTSTDDGVELCGDCATVDADPHDGDQPS
jgi:hypothetical protein